MLPPPGDHEGGARAASDSDTNGTPTAACSLRSSEGAKPQVSAVVTWLQLDDDALGRRRLRQPVPRDRPHPVPRAERLQAAGADQACAGVASVGGADSVTIAAVGGRAVVTARISSVPPGPQPVLTRGTQMLEGVLLLARRQLLSLP